MYQIFTYVKNYDRNNTGNVAGMLLYAETDKQTVDSEYHMNGNTISVKTLDLNRDFKEIRRQLDDIVAVYFI